MHDMTWSLLLALTHCSEENEERDEKRLTKCWWLLNWVIVFIAWLFLLLCTCLKFFTIRVKISSHLRKERYGKEQTGSLVHLISRCTKLARTSCPAKDGNSIFWLSIWLFLVLKSGRISLVHYSGHLRWIIQKMFLLVVVFLVSHFVLTRVQSLDIALGTLQIHSIGGQLWGLLGNEIPL